MRWRTWLSRILRICTNVFYLDTKLWRETLTFNKMKFSIKTFSIDFSANWSKYDQLNDNDSIKFVIELKRHGVLKYFVWRRSSYRRGAIYVYSFATCSLKLRFNANNFSTAFLLNEFPINQYSFETLNIYEPSFSTAILYWGLRINVQEMPSFSKRILYKFARLKPYSERVITLVEIHNFNQIHSAKWLYQH